MSYSEIKSRMLQIEQNLPPPAPRLREFRSGVNSIIKDPTSIGVSVGSAAIAIITWKAASRIGLVAL